MQPLRLLRFLRIELRDLVIEALSSSRSFGQPLASIPLASFQMPSSGLSSGA